MAERAIVLMIGIGFGVAGLVLHECAFALMSGLCIGYLMGLPNLKDST